ncbi:MAG: lipase family protein [Bdellovibrionota bacterium]
MGAQDTKKSILLCIALLVLSGVVFAEGPETHRATQQGPYQHYPLFPLPQTIQPPLAPLPFDPAKNAFDLDNATFFAWLSKVAYLKKEDGSPDMPAIQKELAGIPDASIEPIDSAPVQGFIVKAKGYAVVVFRGSDERDDWFDNFNAFYLGQKKPAQQGFGRPNLMKKPKQNTVPSPNSRHDLHAGFYEQFSKAHDQVLEKLKGTESGKVWFTGHSLGGALATIFARDFHAAHGFKNIGLYTFGAPRPGNQKLANYFNENTIPTYRVEFGHDPVPTLPDARFRPVGELVHISEDSAGKCSISDENRLQVFMRTVTSYTGLAINHHDHGMDNYLNCLRQIPR